MKLAICSDLHLEFGPITLKNTDNASILVLAGDIIVAKNIEDPVFDVDKNTAALDSIVGSRHNKRYHEFFDAVCKEFPLVLYVIGNHEHYNYDFNQTVPHLKRVLSHHTNLHILDKESMEIDDKIFVGSTLWTSMNHSDSVTLFNIRRMMTDFRVIANNTTQKSKLFTPEDCVEQYESCLQHLVDVYNSTNKDIVYIGHHTPSMLSCSLEYRGDHVMNGGFHNSLDEFIFCRPRIKLWIHGHTHDPFDYTIGETRVFCNPRGYDGREHRASQFKLEYVDV